MVLNKSYAGHIIFRKLKGLHGRLRKSQLSPREPSNFFTPRGRRMKRQFSIFLPAESSPFVTTVRVTDNRIAFATSISFVVWYTAPSCVLVRKRIQFVIGLHQGQLNCVQKNSRVPRNSRAHLREKVTFKIYQQQTSIVSKFVFIHKSSHLPFR